MLHEPWGIVDFDTGFPVDHGHSGKVLGPEVSLLVNGSPDEVARRTQGILHSGIKAGGRLILQEANALPPCVPVENLKAVYETCLEHGWH